MLTAILALALGGAPSHIVTEMTPERVKEALQASASVKADDIHYDFGPRMMRYGFFTTPYSRVVFAAYSAKKKYKPFTEADVTPQMLAPEVEVYASSRQRAGGRSMDIANVEAVVIVPKGSKDVATAIHPIRTEEVTDEYKNLMGAQTSGKSIMAVFPLDALKPGHEILVVYDAKVGAVLKSCSECRSEIKLDDVR